MVVELRPPDTCCHCGRKMNDAKGGYGSVNGLSLCHPNVPDRPDCYHFVTVYYHTVADCARCSQDPWEPMTRDEWHESLMDTLHKLKSMVEDFSP